MIAGTKIINMFENVHNLAMISCRGLTLARCQALTRAPLSVPFLGLQGLKIAKDSWDEIKTWRDHSPDTITGITDST